MGGRRKSGAFEMYMEVLAGKKGIDEKEAGSNEDGKSFFWVEHSEAKVETQETMLLYFYKIVQKFL